MALFGHCDVRKEEFLKAFSILTCSWKGLWSEPAEKLEVWVTSFSSWARASWVSEEERVMPRALTLGMVPESSPVSGNIKAQPCKAQGNKLGSSYEGLNSFQFMLSGDTWGRAPLQPRLKWAELFSGLNYSLTTYVSPLTKEGTNSDTWWVSDVGSQGLSPIL